MLTYSFNLSEKKTLYEQLYRYIREDIIAGKLPGGTRLPSKRSFAKQLGISTVTVENAYGQLMAEGYIYALPRKGFYVEMLGDSDGNVVQEPAILQKHASELPEPEQSRHKTFRIDLSSNQNEPDSFPFSIWARLSREMLRDCRRELMQNPPTGGILSLREAIAEHLYSWRGIRVSPRRIVVGAGTDILYGLLIQLLGFDKVYALEDPGYRKLSNVYGAYKVCCRMIPVDRCGLDMEALRKTDTQVVHVTPSHHFPTGVTMPAARRYELLRWAGADASRYILEDDYDSEFRMSGKPLPALISMDRSGKVIYMNTFTKTLSSTIRVSYMVLPPTLASRFEEELSFYSCSVPVLEQYTLCAFIRRGYFEKHLNRMRTANRKKRDHLLSLLAHSRMGNTLTVLEQDAGLHFLINLALETSGDVFLERLRKKGIHMLPLSAFFHGDPRKLADWKLGDGQIDHTFLINYSSLSKQQIEEAVIIMEGCICEEIAGVTG